MRTQNLVLLTGYVANEPKEKIFDNGTKCVNVTLKTIDFYGKGEDKKKEKNFHNLILWNGISEMAATILEKGDVMQITGRLKNYKVEGKNGEKDQFRTEVVVQDWTRIPIMPEEKSED